MLRSDLIIAGTNFIFSHIKENYLKYLNDKKKLMVIFRGINVDYFDSTTKIEVDEKKLLKKWDIEKDKKIILLPGRLTYWKGQEIFIEAIDEENIGMLMANSIIETIAACIYFDVDPFDQPAVEQGKVLTKKYLS